jgi:hypothetical protein
MSVLFDSLEIRNFRAFDYLKIEHLGNVNLFLGKNNIGKSTLLEALYLYANLGAPQAIRSILDERNEPLSMQYAGTAEPAVWYLFHGRQPLEQINNSIQIGRLGAPDSSLTLSIKWLRRINGIDDSTGLGDGSGYGGGAMAGLEYMEFDSPGSLDTEESIPALVVKCGQIRRHLRLDDAYDALCRRWRLHRQPQNEFVTPCVFVVAGGLDEMLLHSLWGKIALTDAKRDVIEALRIIVPESEDFALLPQQGGRSSFCLSMRGRDEPCPIKTMGDGMNRLVGLNIALAYAQNGILLVDEIENGIHWSVLPEVWKFIVKVARRLNVQVFATTHSQDCLKSFYMGTKDAEDIDGIAVRIEKKNGEFHTEIFDEQRLAVIIEEEIEIR